MLDTYNRFSKTSGNNYPKDYCEKTIAWYDQEIFEADNDEDVMTALALRAERREVQMYLNRGWN
jgi:hypothetical protein